MYSEPHPLGLRFFLSISRDALTNAATATRSTGEDIYAGFTAIQSKKQIHGSPDIKDWFPDCTSIPKQRQQVLNGRKCPAVFGDVHAGLVLTSHVRVTSRIPVCVGGACHQDCSSAHKRWLLRFLNQCPA